MFTGVAMVTTVRENFGREFCTLSSTPLRPPPSPTILSEPITTILYLFVLGEKIKNAQNHHASEMPRKVTFRHF